MPVYPKTPILAINQCGLGVTTLDAKVLGERIRIARERLGMSQTHLARLIAKDQRAVSEYEHGERRIFVTDLPAFAEALDVPLLYFFEGDVTPQDLEHRILAEFRRLPNQQAQVDAVQLLKVFSEALQNQEI